MRLLFTLFFVFAMGFPHLTLAQVGMNVEIKILQSAAGRYGGCAAWVTPDPKAALYPNASCTNHWVTFDCEGQFTQVGSSKSVGQINYSNAQLAFVTGKSAFVEIYPELSDDGYCYATRIDIVYE